MGIGVIEYIPMNNQERVDTYIQGVKKVLGLSSWDLTVVLDEVDEEQDSHNTVMAEVRKVPDRPCAVVIIRPSFFKEDIFQQRHYVVHELVHLHIDRLWKYITKLEPLLGQLAFSLYSEAARSDMEEVVDALAYVVEERVPLPLLFFPRGEKEEPSGS